MKKNIFLAGLLLVVGLTSCSDFLDVESESKYEDPYVFGAKEEINRALSGVYNYLLSGNTYGGAYYTTFCLNSDVEFTTNSNMMKNTAGNEYKAFDCTPSGSALYSTWTSAYTNIEYANNFIAGASQSKFAAERDSVVLSQIGEARVLRAMNYHDLVVLFGDVPFKMERSYDKPHELVTPIVSRDEILKTLIADLREAAPTMRFAASNGTIRKASKELCWALIARMSLTYAGYSLRPGANQSEIGTMQRPDDYAEYYKIAMEYADSVIQSGTHSLAKRFDEVFIDECNYRMNLNDDPIFEIPFTKTLNGSVGYTWGPSAAELDGETPHVWGKCGGSMSLNIFYRWDFQDGDLRRNYTVPLWNYDNTGKAAFHNNAFTSRCGKWSKLWQDESVAMGPKSAGNDGIAFPYMRYADVLLMYAEAANEVNNRPTAAAQEALKTVRRRAFLPETYAETVDSYVAAAGNKEDFFKLIMDERKYEFGGEGLRWRDLVRWDKYAETVRDVFYKYYGAALAVGGDEFYFEGFDQIYPIDIFYRNVDVNPGYDYTKFGSMPVAKSMPVLEIANPLTFMRATDCPKIKDGSDWLLAPGDEAWTTANFFTGLIKDDSTPNAQCCYSLRGYIVGDEFGGTPKPNLWEVAPKALPAVRYILPIPEKAVSSSNGTYKNYYGY